VAVSLERLASAGEREHGQWDRDRDVDAHLSNRAKQSIIVSSEKGHSVKSRNSRRITPRFEGSCAAVRSRVG
jgi:hypothetical protein